VIAAVGWRRNLAFSHGFRLSGMMIRGKCRGRQQGVFDRSRPWSAAADCVLTNFAPYVRRRAFFPSSSADRENA
jgi:hypothetical protein